MGNLNQLVDKTDLTHREISSLVGSAKNWFNDAYNNNEDIHISSFIKVLSVVHSKLDLGEYNLIEIFDRNVLKIASLMNYLSDNGIAYLDEIIATDHSIFVELIADWKSMDFRRKLNEVEQHNLNQIILLISKGAV